MTSLPPDRSNAFRDALYGALAGDPASVRDDDVLATLGRAVAPALRGAGAGVVALEALSGIAAQSTVDAAVEAASQRFETPAQLAEAVYLARSLSRDAALAGSLLRARRYVEDAEVPLSLLDLNTDRIAVLDATSFAALWREPARGESMLGALNLWRRDYTNAYVSRHAHHQTQVAAIAEAVDAAAPVAGAVERLNTLSRLGPPLGLAALLQLRDLQHLSPCTLAGAELLEALTDAPSCPQCAYRLDDLAPTAEARRARQAIDRALAGQQARLARTVVARILARPAEGGEQRLTRFIQVVQASDLSGLALVMDDDGLVEFIATLLDASGAPPDLLTRLAEAYPEVSTANIDDAVEAFRVLLQSELANGGRVRLHAPELA